MTQICVNTFYSECIVFVSYITNMLAGIYNIHINQEAICCIFSGVRSLVYDFLQPFRALSYATSNPTIWRGERLTSVVIYTFSRVFELGLRKTNQYNSSISRISYEFSATGSVFFNPVVDVGFAKTKKVACSATTHAGIICLYGFGAHFLRVRYWFRLKCICDISIIALAPLCAGPVFPNVYLICGFSTASTFSPFNSFCFSHASIVSQATLLAHSSVYDYFLFGC